MDAFRDIGKFGQRRLQGRGNKELDLFGGETRELLCQPVKDRRVVEAFLRKRLDDRKGSPHEPLGFVPAECVLSRSPFIDFVEGIREIKRRVQQKIPVDADLPLFSIDYAQIGAFESAQACPQKIDPSRSDVVSSSQEPRVVCIVSYRSRASSGAYPGAPLRLAAKAKFQLIGEGRITT